MFGLTVPRHFLIGYFRRDCKEVNEWVDVRPARHYEVDGSVLPKEEWHGVEGAREGYFLEIFEGLQRFSQERWETI